MTYSPGHNSPSSCTRALASSRVCTASTRCTLLSLRNLKMQKGRRNWNSEINTYRGDLRVDSGAIITRIGETGKAVSDLGGDASRFWEVTCVLGQFTPYRQVWLSVP